VWGLFVIALATHDLHAGTPGTRRAGFSAGLGVNYLSQRDVIDMVNGGYSPSKRLDDYHAAVDFSGAFVLPVSERFALRFEYAYLLNTVNTAGPLGPGEFTTTVHMPSVIVEYSIVDAPMYNLSAGIGGGYHPGRLAIDYGTIKDTYTANGPGLVVILVGNSAIGEDLFIHLAGTMRLGMLGELRNANGQSPGKGSSGSPATLGTFSIGARIGLSYYL
jgi:hypothetical protein